MKITIIGTGYVGLVSGACFAEFGFEVTCLDSNKEKIEKLRKSDIDIYEPGLKLIVEKNIKANRLSFSVDYKSAIQSSEVIFICVGTPPLADGAADLKHVLEVASNIGELMNNYKIIVNKSTVPVGTGEMVRTVIQNKLTERNNNYEFDVASNPEFLREGAAINDFMHPDRIVIGAETERARNIMREVYRVLFLNNHPFVFTDIKTAELIKYASNAFLATKISFINEIANFCEEIGGNVQDVSRAMGLDKRIGRFFLHAGPGYGGSCFPKDTRALVHIGELNNADFKIVKSVIEVNENQKRRMINKIINRMDGVKGKKIAILGLSFKAETNDMRESPSIDIITGLALEGALINVYDPQAMETARETCFSSLNISYSSDEYDAIFGADALVIITDWNQFRALDLERILNLMNSKYFFDFRNIYDKSILEEKGFIYEGVGI